MTAYEICNIIILSITAIVVFWYACETKKLREGTYEQAKSLKQQNTFDTLTKIHERMPNRDSYEMRMNQ
ncbi:MAG: hypothetical protein XD85_0201 [Parcubacteria bacterium 34_609]|nr:MAG: hypothetical protein XD85_0201 [Parcubacteria bacterium 34_609]MBP8717997.1 hypothetical protein [Candidatus Atribacteria bacterium]